MSVEKLSQLVTVGELAVAMVQAESEAKARRAAYHDRIREYESEEGRITGRLDPGNPLHAGAIRFTSAAYSEYLEAKKVARNIKKRMESAAKKTTLAA